jgi:hydroxypyruvate reductase
VLDASTLADVRDIVNRYDLDLPAAARAVLERGEETPKQGAFSTDVRLIAAPSLALEACAQTAVDMGLHPLILGDAIEGEAREVGVVMAGIAASVARFNRPVAKPAVLLSGGETTVSIGKGPVGRGGRNTEFLLAFALAMKAHADIWALAGDSDGIDGTDDAAGAIVTPDTLHRAAVAGLDARGLLAGHDSYRFFDGLGDLIRTGPTLTNVNDIRAILVC